MIVKVFLFLVCASMTCCKCGAVPPPPSNFEVVLHGGESVSAVNGVGPTRFYHGGLCKIQFPGDGYFFVTIQDKTVENAAMIFAPNPNSFCKDNTGTVKYKQQTDGNFVIYCNGKADYLTHTNQDTRGSFMLLVDTACRLHIVEQVWTSELFAPLGINDRLYKGQYLFQDGYMLEVDPYNGVLTVKLPTGGGGFWVVWQSGDTGVEPPANHHDFYAKVTAQGRLILVAVDYTSGPRLTESEYFSKDLNPTTDCFTMGVIHIEDGHGVGSRDLVAVPCEESGERRTLRGSAA